MSHRMPPGWARRVHTLALRCLPPELREHRGREMGAAFDELYGAARARGRWAALRVVALEAWDLVGSGARLRLDELRRRARRPTTTGGGEAMGDAMGETWQDVRIAVRTLAKRPGFLALATLTLALGIGANTAVFSVVNAVVLRPLPYPDADELVMVWHTIPRLGWERGPFSHPSYEAVRDRTGRLEDLAIFTGVGAEGTLRGQGPPNRVRGSRVSGGLFPLLGVDAALGRTILPVDDDPAAEPVAVLGHALWTTAFGADPDVIGRPFRMQDRAPTIVGVMPPDFPPLRNGDQFWLPLALDEEARAQDMNYLQLMARLGRGSSVESARAEVAAILRAFTRDSPDDRDRGAYVETRHDMVVGDVRAQLLLMLGAVALVLLAACANVAGLTLTRSAGRRREHALRRALGSGRGRLVRHLLTESALVAAAGGAAGIGVAYALTEAIVRLGPTDLPRRAEIGVDPAALGFLLAATVGCALVFGLLPALQGAGTRPGAVLREVGGRGASARGRGQQVLASVQVALAFVLVVGGGLLVGSLARLQAVDLGFEPAGVLTARVPLELDDDAERVAFVDDLLARVDALPSVEGAALAWSVPFGSTWGSTSVRAEGAEPPPAGAAAPLAQMVPVRGDVVGALGLELVAGDPLPAAVSPEDPLVVLVNETLARALWPDGDAVGRRFRRGNEEDNPWNTVVGVVADTRSTSLEEEPPLMLYQPLPQAAWIEEGYLIVRTAGVDPRMLADPVRALVAEWDPDVAVDQIATLESRVRASAAEPRFRALLVGSFAVLVALLAVVGVYGVMGLMVAGRVRDIGVRMALGAGRDAVLLEVLRGGARISALGIAGGLAGALLLAGVLEGLLYGIGPRDPATYAGAAALLLVATLAAAVLPARRASTVEPMAVLREE